uniref:Uncharacterized protein n=1 Tax=Arundo donax TaxID=35708 RepID=A0A0A8YWV7_ARUDO
MSSSKKDFVSVQMNWLQLLAFVKILQSLRRMEESVEYLGKSKPHWKMVSMKLK